MHAGATGDTALRRLMIVLTVIGACGIALVFLPFAYGVVPVTDVLLDFELESLWFWALPAILLPFPITIGYLLWLSGRMPSWGSAAGWILWGLGPVCLLMGLMLDFPGTSGLVVLLPAAACYAGGAWLARTSGVGSGPPGSFLAMQSAYLANVGIFVGEFIDEGDIGVWLAGITIVAYLLQFALAIGPRWGRLAIAWLPPVAALVLGAACNS